MNSNLEQERLQELYDYKVFDTSPDTELDELVEIASVICEAPISLITIVDENTQWFKANKGLPINGTPRQDAFCQYALQNPAEPLVVHDPLNDERFKNNPLVLGDPSIRFYAGAPLETPNGHVLGTLCVIDNKPRPFTKTQERALMLLAKKAMNILETRKLLLNQESIIDFNAARIKKLTDYAPGAIYQLELNSNGRLYFSFISEGFTRIHPKLDPETLKENAESAFSVIHPEDVEAVRQSLMESYTHLSNWEVEYRVIEADGKAHWHWCNAKPEKKEDGTVVWYGTFQDITPRKEYIQTLEQILFDISHVMRKPVASLLGLTTALKEHLMDANSQKQYIEYIHKASLQMDSFIHQLNEQYQETKTKVSTSSSAK